MNAPKSRLSHANIEPAMHTSEVMMGMGVGGGGPMPDGRTTGSNTQIPLRAGDWICHHCAGHNFANRTSCFTCERPAAVSGSVLIPHGPAAHHAHGFGGSGNFKPGDWLCETCGAHNFASRNVCVTCNHTHRARRRPRSPSRSDRRRSHSKSRSDSRCRSCRAFGLCFD